MGQPPERIVRVASLKTVDAFRAHVAALGIDLACEDEILGGSESPLAQPLRVDGRVVGNRWTVQPMEGWDGTPTGGATETVRRRWRRFGLSGAKVIWGGEAMAVRADGRANPHQLIIEQRNKADLGRLRDVLVRAHRETFGTADDLLIGFQLTHSGRFCRPHDKKRLEPRIAYRHPILDRKFGIDSDDCVLSDDEVARLVERYVAAARIADEVGADFVDIKHCHGYLLHEFLSAYTRPGKYGGPLENRTRVLREIVGGIRAGLPGGSRLMIGVRLSAFDVVPFRPDPARGRPGRLGPGIPEPFEDCLPYRYAFGCNQDWPVEPDLAEPCRLLDLLAELDVRLVNLSAGSPYYNPHIQRPAAFPPSDGYQPPEDPLVGVARQINMVRQLKARAPRDMAIVGTAYSYLQEYLPQVAQYYVRHGHVDSIGLGRMMLAYPTALADAVYRGAYNTKQVCRTFSDCTTAPRNGLRSGCYPLDEFYKRFEDAPALRGVKKAAGV